MGRNMNDTCSLISVQLTVVLVLNVGTHSRCLDTVCHKRGTHLIDMSARLIKDTHRLIGVCK